MESKIMDEKSKIADILKVFKELISLHSDKIKDLSSYEYCLQYIEENIEGEDENDLDYLETLHVNLVEEWLKLKRSVLNPNNKDNKCFQYSITLSLYHEQIGKSFCRISTIKPFIDNLNW